MMKYLLIITAFCCCFYQNSRAQQLQSKALKTIKIGLLINDKNADGARHGAEMAIREANKKGGVKGIPFQLVTRSMEGPWGTGSKQAVDLIFNENVWALLGSHDGRNAHLVEQVVAKTHVVFLSAWASDPTLSQAYVPWFFNCAPNRKQQVEVLINDLYNKRKINKIAILSDKDYDSKLALQNLITSIKKTGHTTPLQLYFDNKSNNFNSLLDTINKADPKAILIFGQSETVLKFISQLRAKKMNQPIYGFLSLLEAYKSMEIKNFNNITLVSSEQWLGSKGSDFKNTYQKKYGKIPREVAAYAFDGMSVIIKAIKQSWPNRENIQNAMSNIYYDGVTGAFHFDKNGNRIGTLDLVELKNGIPVITKK